VEHFVFFLLGCIDPWGIACEVIWPDQSELRIFDCCRLCTQCHV